MEACLKEVHASDPKLAQVLSVVASVVVEISTLLREQGDVTALSGGDNTFGDHQLKVDCAVDELIFKRLGECSACEAASSEEQPEMRDLQGQGYTVVFDPLDGSSIVGANFAVGTIFGVWPGHGVAGRCGREQAAAAYAVYGPRTMLVWACPSQGGLVVHQWVLSSQNRWKPLTGPISTNPHTNGQPVSPTTPTTPTVSTPTRLVAQSKPIFAPANLRCCAQNATYRKLVDTWVDRGFTLRYTGGMVPDVHHILAKGGGVFVNPASSAAPAKLRLVYECAPLSFILEAAGGASHDGQQSILDTVITSTTHKSAIVLGSKELVMESLTAMQSTA